VPTYIDKPLANNLAEAKEIVALAEANGTPLTCASGLRYVPEVANFHARAAEIGRIRSGMVTGPGELFYYGIHAAELLHALFGAGIAWVSNAGDDEKDLGTVGYADGRTIILQIVRFGGHGWEFCYYSDRVWDRVPVIISGWSFYRGVVEQAVQLVATGRGGPSHDEMIEVIAILEAMRRSAATGERIDLPRLIAET
jgi:predicted dehydrogenase